MNPHPRSRPATPTGSQPVDPSPPKYLPHRDGVVVLQMGLSRLEASDWLELDYPLAPWLAFKRGLAELDFAAVYGDDGAASAAVAELSQLLEEHLLKHHAQRFRREGDAICEAPSQLRIDAADGPPLWRASLLVADDIALMVPRDGVYHLAAASLCSPSHWRLADKLGRPIREVHDPIPGVHQDLSPRIDRFFDHLRVDAPVRRYNWSLQLGDRRFAPSSLRVNRGDGLYYRVERQSLRRLPGTGAIAFTIRVYLHPLEALRPIPGALESLLTAVRDTPPALAAYKGFDRYLPVLEEFLAAGAGDSA